MSGDLRLSPGLTDDGARRFAGAKRPQRDPPTFRDTLTLSTGYARDAVDPACSARLMDAMADELSRIA